MMRVAVTLAALASASAFAPISAPMGLKLRAQNVARAPRSAGLVMQASNPMTNAVAEFAAQNPELASRGLGVTTNAERWNGRHAMFGMFFMAFTAYLKGHGLIPDADKVLDPATWGPLAYGGFGTQITNERAIILIAHVQVNEEDQLRIISMQKGSDILAVFSRLADAANKIESKAKFANDSHFGYVSTCPTNMGTG